MHWADGWGWGSWFAMSLMMIVFWCLLIAGIVFLVRVAGGRREDEPTRDDRTPERILEERYARGEIDDEDFKRRRELLRPRS